MKRVLLADDSVAARKSIQTMLEMAGIEVVAVGNGDLAFARLDEIAPHMVLLDAIMPGRSGYEVCAEIKRDPARRSLPVLIVTTEFEPYDERAAAAAGADGHLIKPLDAGSLEAIREVWELYAEASPEPAEPEAPPEPARPAVAMPGPETFITNTMKAPELPEEGSAPFDLVLPGVGPAPAPGIRSPLPDHVVEPRPAPRVQRAPTTDNLVIEADEHAPVATGAPAQVRTVPVADLRSIDRGCPACGTKTSPGDIFCLACGAMVLVSPEEADRIESMSFCVECNQELLPGEVICVSCGAVV
jgi:CheY-like chemotaxis protein